MDASSVAIWLGIVVSCITLFVWAWKVILYYKRLIHKTEEDAAFGEKLARDLVSRATNAERRADIYTYFTLRSIEIASRRQQMDLFFLGASIFTVAIFFIGSSLSLIPPRIDSSSFTWVMNGLFLIVIASEVALWVFDQFYLRKLEKGWQAGLSASLTFKLEGHL